MIDSLDDSETVLFSLAQSVEERDSALGQHCHRLALMGAAMGVALGLPGNEILSLQRAAYLHDIGKVAIPDHILFKPGPLTPEEWEVMKTHAERGERICSSMRSLAPVLPIIRHHHERWDGSGYPDGLRNEEIPLLARILQLADIYDALTTSRPYKTTLSSEEALQIIRDEAERGWRDPELVQRFAEILPMFRTPTLPDLSRLSLHALAASIERFRKNPLHSHTQETILESNNNKLLGA
jgi:putative two-component system response regulator